MTNGEGVRGRFVQRKNLCYFFNAPILRAISAFLESVLKFRWRCANRQFSLSVGQGCKFACHFLSKLSCDDASTVLASKFAIICTDASTVLPSLQIIANSTLLLCQGRRVLFRKIAITFFSTIPRKLALNYGS